MVDKTNSFWRKSHCIGVFKHRDGPQRCRSRACTTPLRSSRCFRAIQELSDLAKHCRMFTLWCDVDFFACRLGGGCRPTVDVACFWCMLLWPTPADGQHGLRASRAPLKISNLDYNHPQSSPDLVREHADAFLAWWLLHGTRTLRILVWVGERPGGCITVCCCRGGLMCILCMHACKTRSHP